MSVLLLIGVGLWNDGCSSTKEVSHKLSPDKSLKEFLNTYEKSFNPADYDPDVTKILEEVKRQRASLEAATVATSAVPETIPGFRVQVLFTQEIDQANQLREDLAARIPDEWVYVVYDAPYYKVRVGNFVDRTTANHMVRKLSGMGQKDSWIVPDNVMKNPPPKPPDTFIEPEKQIEQHR